MTDYKFIALFLLTSGLQTLDTIAQQTGDSRVIAHRGAWKNTGAPQNSIAALKAAINLNCYGSEFDVWMTADGVAVVNHDKDFYGVLIEKSSYEELQNYSHPNGEKIPTLKAYLSAGKKQRKTKLILEIKGSGISESRTLELTRKCVDLVKALNLRSMVEYISFSHASCLLVKELDAKAPVAYLNGDRTPEQIQNDQLDGIDYNFRVLKNNEQYLQQARERGLSVNVWTVNDQPLMLWFLDRGVDFITTDEPEKLIALIRQRK